MCGIKTLKSSTSGGPRFVSFHGQRMLDEDAFRVTEYKGGIIGLNQTYRGHDVHTEKIGEK